MSYIEDERTVLTSIVGRDGDYLSGAVSEEMIFDIINFVYKNKYCAGLPPKYVDVTSIAVEINVNGSVVRMGAEQIWIEADDYIRLDKKLLK